MRKNVLELKPKDRLRGDATVRCTPFIISKSSVPEHIGKVSLVIQYKHHRRKTTLIVPPDRNFEVMP